MKRTLLTLALGLFVFTSFAQKKINEKRPHYPNKSKSYQRPLLTTEFSKLALDSVIFSNPVTDSLSLKMEFFYDQKGNSDVTNYYTYDYEKVKWVPSSKDNDFYDKSGNDTLYLDYIWIDSTSSWVLNTSTKWTYNASNLIVNEITTYYDTETEEIYQVSERELTYDAQNNILTAYRTLTLTSFGETYTINNNENYLNSYDKNNNLISYYIVEDMDTTSGTVSEFDEKNNLIKDYNYSKNRLTDILELSDSIIYTYDQNFFTGDYIIPWWTKFPNVNLLTEATITNIYEEVNTVEKIVFHYSTKDLTPIFKNSQTNASVTIYPNPVKESFTVAIEENKTIESVEIIDLNGTSVLKIDAPQNARVETSDLGSGIYFCKILSNGKSYTQKIIVQ